MPFVLLLMWVRHGARPKNKEQCRVLYAGGMFYATDLAGPLWLHDFGCRSGGQWWA